MDERRMSVVMPSYNQGRYLDAAITSVLSQGHDVELIVMDGGSTDESVEVLERWAPQLAHWQSEPDGGQADALNKGFARASGGIFAWVNSDDYLLPGTLSRVRAAMANQPRAVLHYGHAVMIREGVGAFTKPAFAVPDAQARVSQQHTLVQPSSFWHRQVWEQAGELDATLHYAFDWEWFIRAAAVAHFDFSPSFYSVYRIHDQHKTGTGGEARRREICEVARRHAAKPWQDDYLRLLDWEDRFASVAERLASVNVGEGRAVLAAALLHGEVPHGPRQLKRWSTILRMYAA